MSIKLIRVYKVYATGPFINEYLEKFNKKPEFKEGLRVTDTETMG